MSIPRTVRLSAALAHQSRFVGEYRPQSDARLAQACAPGTDVLLQVDLQLDERRGYAGLSGHIDGTVPLECQRCGKTYSFDLALTPDLRLVDSDEDERAVLADIDPYRIEDDQLPLQALIEDEVLLALPMLPRCESCENAIRAAEQRAEPEASDKRENPFAAFKQKLKSNRE